MSEPNRSKRSKRRRDIAKAIYRELRRQEEKGYTINSAGTTAQQVHPFVGTPKQIDGRMPLSGGFDLDALAEAVLQATESQSS